MGKASEARQGDLLHGDASMEKQFKCLNPEDATDDNGQESKRAQLRLLP